MSAILPALLPSASALIAQPDELRSIKVEVRLRTDHVQPAPAGEPPTRAQATYRPRFKPR